MKLAHLSDPFAAVDTSNIEPYPHQIDAVYNRFLEQQPLRFLLADDPGAGKTIMSGLLIRELMLRGDVARCLIVAPGSLVEQWQDELWEKFGLELRDDVPRGMVEASRTGNPFLEKNLLIARVDQLSRSRGAHGEAGGHRLGSGHRATRPTRCRPTSTATSSTRPSASSSASCSATGPATSCC